MHYSIQGFKGIVESGTASIESVEKSINKFCLTLQQCNCFGQIVSAKAIASEKHCLAALEQTITAFADNSGIAKNQNIELLLRLAGKRQVQEALQLLELKEGMQEAVILISGKNEKKVKECFEKAVKELKFKTNFEILEKNIKKNFESLKKTFEISNSELESLAVFEKHKALENAILERTAMLGSEGKKQ